MKQLQEVVKEISEVRFIKDNEDGTKQYAISSSGELDLRKKLFEVLPKQEIVIFELKKSESTLEDAFIKLIDTTSSKQVEEPSKEKEAQKAQKKEQKAKEKEEKAKAKQAKKEENKKKGGDK